MITKLISLAIFFLQFYLLFSSWISKSCHCLKEIQFLFQLISKQQTYKLFWRSQYASKNVPSLWAVLLMLYFLDSKTPPNKSYIIHLITDFCKSNKTSLHSECNDSSKSLLPVDSNQWQAPSPSPFPALQLKQLGNLSYMFGNWGQTHFGAGWFSNLTMSSRFQLASIGLLCHPDCTGFPSSCWHVDGAVPMLHTAMSR